MDITIKIAKDGMMTSLELLEQINLFRKQEGDRAELQHKDLLKIIRDEFEEEINEGKISPITYKDKKGEDRPMYILTLNQSRQVLVRESKFVRRKVINYITTLENELDKKNKLLMGLFSDDKTKVAECHKALIELETQELKKELAHKEDVIIGLVDDIELRDKRQILNQVVRYGKADYKNRWKILYQEFEAKYHFDLTARLDTYNKEHKKKISKLDYIETEMKKLPELYELACKLFNTDIENIISRYRDIC